jgi:RNA polymerase primary sigma factor
MIDEELINVLANREEDEHPVIARLIELGRQKSYITIDDILGFFPDAESDIDQLEEVFAALLSAGIPYLDDSVVGAPTEDELTAVEEEEVE